MPLGVSAWRQRPPVRGVPHGRYPAQQGALIREGIRRATSGVGDPTRARPGSSRAANPPSERTPAGVRQPLGHLDSPRAGSLIGLLGRRCGPGDEQGYVVVILWVPQGVEQQVACLVQRAAGVVEDIEENL